MARRLNKEEAFNLSIVKAMKTYLFASLLLSTFNLPNAAATDPAPVVAPSTRPFELTVIRRREPMNVQVLVAKQRAGEVSIALKNSRGETLYRTSLSKKDRAHSLVLNLSQLADGAYTLEASGQGQVLSRTVNLQTPAAERMLALR